jgi:phage anti-repressor protein
MKRQRIRDNYIQYRSIYIIQIQNDGFQFDGIEGREDGCKIGLKEKEEDGDINMIQRMDSGRRLRKYI